MDIVAMQSIFQYRRQRAHVKADLANASAAFKTRSSPASTPPEEKPAVQDATPTKHQTEIEPDLRGPTSTSSDSLNLIPGVTLSLPDEKDAATTFVVGWKEGDALNPQNWSERSKWACTLAVCLLTLAITIPSSIDAPVADQFDEHFAVNAEAGSMTTGMYLIGLGVGALFAGTISETFGRNVIYLTTFIIFMIFIMAKALAPNYGSAIVFRFLSGFFGSTPLTAAGGTIADMWSPLQMIYVVPVGAMTAYAGPIVGPILGAYLPNIGFRWSDWLSLIIAGAVLLYVTLFQPETYQPVLLEWRAKHLREQTGDARYQTATQTTTHLATRLLVNIYRPFAFVSTEPVIQIFTFYLLIVYFVLFTFLNGYPYIFAQTYGISVSLTFILWVALLVGDLAALPLIPIVYKWAVQAAKEGKLAPEYCLWYGMLGGSFALPISLWWMAWTCYVSSPLFLLRSQMDGRISRSEQPSVSIWAPIIGSVLFGYGLVTIFAMTFLYTCFMYGAQSASALAFMTSVRYIIAGAILPASVPMYQRLGPHLALTIPAALATAMIPVPYILYKYGPKIRAASKNSMH